MLGAWRPVWCVLYEIVDLVLCGVYNYKTYKYMGALLLNILLDGGIIIKHINLNINTKHAGRLEDLWASTGTMKSLKSIIQGSRTNQSSWWVEGRPSTLVFDKSHVGCTLQPRALCHRDLDIGRPLDQ